MRPEDDEAQASISGAARSHLTGVTRLTVVSQGLGASFAAVALFGFFWMNFPASRASLPIYMLAVALLLAIAWQRGDAILAFLSRSHPVLPTLPPTVWFSGALLLGVALRVVAATAFPAKLVSDDAHYLDLAHELANGLDYAAPEGRAYWPPGLPLALAPLLPVFGTSAGLVYNLGTFALAEIATFMLGRLLAGWRVGCLAALFLAVWPNFVFAAPLLQKECLLIALWPAAAFFYLKAHQAISEKKAGGHALLAGGVVGYSVLTQPSSALLPLCLVLFSVLTAGWGRRNLICVLAVSLGIVAVVTPWTVRNYAVLHRLTPIGTAGGLNFFMVTRPQSDGRWAELSAREIQVLGSDEVVHSERAFSLGIEAIREHPLHFLSTVPRKPFYLFGQDIKNTYWTFERGGVGTSVQYATFYWLANGFYLVAIVLISLFAMRKNYIHDTTPALILLWMFALYPILTQSLFEASERHRYGALPIMALFAAMAFCWSAGSAGELGKQPIR